MSDTTRVMVRAPGYRVWDRLRHNFSWTDEPPELSPLVDRWTGCFDKQGRPVYERDILQVHYNTQLGSVPALVLRYAEEADYAAEATGPAGEILRVSRYSFADSDIVGNLH